MILENLIKPIILSEGITEPLLLKYDNFYAKQLTRSDLDADLEGVNSSIEIIQKTRGGSWPSEQLTRDADLLDLAWHEREFNDGNSFAYAIYTNEDEYLGCFYLYGMGLRTPLSEVTIDFEVDASWWVTTEAFKEGYYEKVYLALLQWLSDEFKFKRIKYSNKELPI